MKRNYHASMAALLLLAVFVTLVFAHEYRTRKKAHDRIAVHADMISNVLWHYNEEGASQYLSLAAELEKYVSVTVVDTRGNVLQGVSEIPLQGLDRIAGAMGLILRHSLEAPVRYNDRIIGALKAKRICKSIYFDAVLLLVLVMIFMIFLLYTRLMNEKKVLENRVAYRTKELSEVNTNLQKEIRQHKAARQALEKSEERYRAYFEENIAGAYISTPSGRLIDCNQQYLDIFGFKDKDQALTASIGNIYHRREERQQFLNALEENKKCPHMKQDLKKRTVP